VVYVIGSTLARCNSIAERARSFDLSYFAAAMSFFAPDFAPKPSVSYGLLNS